MKICRGLIGVFLGALSLASLVLPSAAFALPVFGPNGKVYDPEKHTKQTVSRVTNCPVKVLSFYGVPLWFREYTWIWEEGTAAFMSHEQMQGGPLGFQDGVTVCDLINTPRNKQGEPLCGTYKLNTPDPKVDDPEYKYQDGVPMAEAYSAIETEYYRIHAKLRYVELRGRLEDNEIYEGGKLYVRSFKKGDVCEEYYFRGQSPKHGKTQILKPILLK